MKPVINRRNSVLILSSIFALATLALPATARKWTITERQARLSSQIEAAFKANQLTVKEADDLRKDAGKISERAEKMKTKNAGRLSYEDQNDLEKDLNKLSLKIHKKVLEKRVQ
jgi:hypothetical protein